MCICIGSPASWRHKHGGGCRVVAAAQQVSLFVSPFATGAVLGLVCRLCQGSSSWWCIAGGRSAMQGRPARAAERGGGAAGRVRHAPINCGTRLLVAAQLVLALFCPCPAPGEALGFAGPPTTLASKARLSWLYRNLISTSSALAAVTASERGPEHLCCRRRRRGGGASRVVASGASCYQQMPASKRSHF